MNKEKIRNKYRELRQNLSNEDIEKYSLFIVNQVLQMPIWKHKYYHLFLPIEEQKEVNTQHLLSILYGKDKNVVVSKSNFKTGTMQHYLLTDATVLKLNKWNIPEPEDGIEIPEEKIDVVFVPLLAFDKEGNRLGYGKGFYDRFLMKCKKDVLKIGLSFFDAEETKLDTENWDIALDYCITPKFVYKF